MAEAAERRRGEGTRACPNWGPLTLYALTHKWASSRGNALFAETSDGQVMTFADLRERVDCLAGFLHAQGFRRGDCVLITAGRRVEGILALVAAARLGLDVCIVPQGMSARQATEGAVSYAPKMAIEAGSLADDDWATPRILDLAANLFTIRLVGCFGAAPDGLIDLETAGADLPPLEEPAVEASAEFSPKIHFLQQRPDGTLERITRDQSQLLSQALACAVTASLTQATIVGTAYDPLGAHGLLAVLLPALLVGTSVTLFDALDPALDAHVQLWLGDRDDRRLVLPSGFSQEVGLLRSAAQPGTRIWISHGPAPSGMARDDRLLVDCGGIALVPASLDAEGATLVRPGAILVRPLHGQTLSFGTVRLDASLPDGEAGERSPGVVTNGDLHLSSPLAAARNDRRLDQQSTGQAARLADDAAGKPVYVLTGEEGDAVRVGNQRAHLPAINRALGLTGRWQDAAVFAVPDPVLGHRIEVVVEPRLGDSYTLPNLDMVRSMLSDGGISDAALPVKLHLVSKVPRRGRGLVDLSALDEVLLDEDAPESVDPDQAAVA